MERCWTTPSTNGGCKPADDALAAARDNAARGWNNRACMIAKQAAQLAVKALLHRVGAGGQARGHDLVALLDRAAPGTAFTLTDDTRAAAVRLSRHDQPARYPDALAGGTPASRYSQSDADQAITDSDAVRTAVIGASAALDAVDAEHADEADEQGDSDDHAG